AAAEEALEEVLEEAAEPPEVDAAGGEVDPPEPVVLGSLVGVGEDRIGLVDGLEALLGVAVPRVAIRVVLHGELAERLLDLGVAGVAGDAQEPVVVGGGPGRSALHAGADRGDPRGGASAGAQESASGDSDRGDSTATTTRAGRRTRSWKRYPRCTSLTTVWSGT